MKSISPIDRFLLNSLVSHPSFRRLPIAAMLACGLGIAPTGCHSRAYREVYHKRMAIESRILEDQLYDADYENRVLRDRLEAYQRKVAEGKIPIPAPIHPHNGPNSLGVARPTAPIAEPSRELPADDFEHGFETEDYDLPLFDDGVPVDMGDAAVPDDLGAPTAPDTPDAPELIPVPLPDSNPDSMLPPIPDPEPSSDSTDQLLPAPGGPEPPGKNDIDIPPIEPGEPAPPLLDGEDEVPPGQIFLPDSVRAEAGVPRKLRIHQHHSVGHYTDGKLDGAVIVIDALDATGRPVDMDSFEIDADLSIVALDPNLPPEEARVGRWDFSSAQVQPLVRDTPVSGLHVPIQWQDAAPTGEELIIHVRLRGEDDDMRCQGELKLADQPPITDWTPRATAIR